MKKNFRQKIFYIHCSCHIGLVPKGLPRHALYASLNNSHNNCHRNCTNRIFLQIHMFRLINLCVLWDAYHESDCVFKILCTRDAVPRGTAVTKSLH